MNSAPSLAMRERARPLSPDDRREAILDAVLPILREKGRDVTTRELADAAGIAEGTIFRAFGDKESLLAAGLDKLFAPEQYRAELRSIRHDQPLEAKLADFVEVLRRRFCDVFQIMTVFQVQQPPTGDDRDEWITILRDVFDADRDMLAVSIDELVYFVRLVAFGSSIGPLTADHPFDAAQLAALIVRGAATR